jgi:hypothetical protein
MTLKGKEFHHTWQPFDKPYADHDVNKTTIDVFNIFVILFGIILINMFIATEKVLLYKSGNIESWRLKNLQVRHNNS